MDPFFTLVDLKGGWRVVCCENGETPTYGLFPPNYVILKSGLSQEEAVSLAERLLAALHEDS